MISFRRVCLGHSLAQALAITRHSTRKDDRENIFGRSHSRSENSNSLWFRETKYFSRKIYSENSLILSSLSFFGFGLFRKHNSAHAVMTSSRLHFTLDKTALTCLHSKHSSTCKLHSAVAIGISCTQSLGLDFSPATPRDALQALRAVCAECTHAQ